MELEKLNKPTKKILPNIPQKLPTLTIINPTSDIMNNIQPIKLMVSFFNYLFSLYKY